MSIFGNIKDAAQLEDAMIAHLLRWLPTYQGEIERQNGMEPHSLPDIRSFTTRNEVQKWPEDQLPALVVVSPGTAERPKKDGRGLFRVSFVVGTAVIVSARDKKTTNTLAKRYAAAVRAAVVQQPSLNGFAMASDWESESFNDLPETETRSITSAQNIFKITVDDFVTGLGGPSEPLEEPYTPPGDWPTVDTAIVTVTKEN